MTAFVTVIVVLLWLAVRGRRPKTSRPSAAQRQPLRGAPRKDTRHDDGPIAGLALGHALAQQHYHVPFGDPFPHGHLGDPSSLAFWAGIGETLADDDNQAEDVRDEDED